MHGESQRCRFVSSENSPAVAETSFSIDLPGAEGIVGHHITGVPRALATPGTLVLGLNYQTQAYDPEVGIVGTAVNYYVGKLQFHCTAKYDPAVHTFSGIQHEFMSPIPFDLLEVFRAAVWYKLPTGRYKTSDTGWTNRMGRLVVSLLGGDADLSAWTFRTNVLIVE